MVNILWKKPNKYLLIIWIDSSTGMRVCVHLDLLRREYYNKHLSLNSIVFAFIFFFIISREIANHLEMAV